MRAVLFERFGEPAEVLSLREIASPNPGPGQVRVRMLASPVNPSDLMTVRGVYGKLPTLPASPGYEGVGIVESAGPGLLGRLLIGKRVAVLGGESGAWRDLVLASARQVVPLSHRIPLEQAAMFFVNPTTAYALTRRVLRVPPGEWLLQTAAGSALGAMVIRLGRTFGFRTLNVVRRRAQVDEIRRLGGDAVIATESEDLIARVRELTGGEGVRYALDCVGGKTGSDVVRSLAVGGRLVVYGTLSGEPLAFSSRDLMTPSASIEGFWLACWMPALSLPGKLKVVRTVGKLIRSGVLASEVGQVFPLEQVGEAVRAAERTARGGKVLLTIDPKA